MNTPRPHWRADFSDEEPAKQDPDAPLSTSEERPVAGVYPQAGEVMTPGGESPELEQSLRNESYWRTSSDHKAATIIALTGRIATLEAENSRLREPTPTAQPSAREEALASSATVLLEALEEYSIAFQEAQDGRIPAAVVFNLAKAENATREALAILPTPASPREGRVESENRAAFAASELRTFANWIAHSRDSSKSDLVAEARRRADGLAPRIPAGLTTERGAGL